MPKTMERLVQAIVKVYWFKSMNQPFLTQQYLFRTKNVFYMIC